MDQMGSSTTGIQDTSSLGLSKREGEILMDYQKWRDTRRPFEPSWFVSGAMLRGQQHVIYDDALAKLVSPIAPSYRIRLNINRIRPKIKARLAKFFKNRPKPVVIPASTERKDILNARFTEKALTYIWYKQHLEEKYKDARMWATIASKGLLWIRWDDNINGRIRQDQTDPMTGQPIPGKFTDTSAPIGDVCIEVGSPFELLVADPTISRLGAQPKIIRARYINVKDAQARYPQFEKDPPATGEKLSQYKDLLATLYPRTESVATGMPTALHADQVIEIEHFTAPTDKFPKGRYAVMVGSKVMRDEDELPYEMWDMPENPYPVVEIVDTVAAGQYWGPTQVEQMVDLQREYNFLRGLLSENIRMMARPKIIVYKQHNLQDGAWTNAAGEIVELNWMPGLPDPRIIQPANVAGDVWNLLALISREFDDLTQIYPSSEGKAGDATSGFQTNLLQESANSVHAPDIREDELAIEMLARKIRRMMKLLYTAPRLLNITGPNGAPEVFEFSQAAIDEYAEVRIQVGSMLPDLKSAKISMAMQMFEKGMLGDPHDPSVIRRAMELTEMGGLEVVSEEARRDEDQAYQENQVTTQGQPTPAAQWYEDHPTHVRVHQDELKTPEAQNWPPMTKHLKFAHIVTHYDFLNPPLAIALRQQYSLTDVPIASPPPPPPPPMMPGQPPPGAPPGPGGPPPPAGPPGPPAGPPSPNITHAPQTNIHIHNPKPEAPKQPASGPNLGPPPQASPQ